MAKRGAHNPSLVISAAGGLKAFEDTYGAENMAFTEDWLKNDSTETGKVGVRIVTAAPEIEGVLDAVYELTKRGIVYSIGHRWVGDVIPFELVDKPRLPSTAPTDVASSAMASGARLITHLFNAMPQLHHRDPSIIGLLGASPHLSSYFSPISSPVATTPKSFRRSLSSKSKSILPGIFSGSGKEGKNSPMAASEAFDDSDSPPLSPKSLVSQAVIKARTSVATLDRPFYELIVDGIHSHPNSVRLAYDAHPEGCILITDGTHSQYAT